MDLCRPTRPGGRHPNGDSSSASLLQISQYPFGARPDRKVGSSFEGAPPPANHDRLSAGPGRCDPGGRGRRQAGSRRAPSCQMTPADSFWHADASGLRTAQSDLARDPARQELMKDLLQLDAGDGNPAHPLRRPHPRQHLTTRRHRQRKNPIDSISIDVPTECLLARPLAGAPTIGPAAPTSARA